LPSAPTTTTTILDASCGNGHLTLSLLKLGYNVDATEVSDFYVENVLKKTLPRVMRLSYQEFGVIATDSYDCVISNDVLEHLPTANEVVDAIKNIVRISRNLVLISVGLKSASRYAKKMNLGIPDLHTVKKEPSWWIKKISPYVQILESGHGTWICGHRGYYFFGRKRDASLQ
jgi:2-polyprenyl-3-methyl-5-hydroxy-6-metoxy-1,4-benzoquinol methylase